MKSGVSTPYRACERKSCIWCKLRLAEESCWDKLQVNFICQSNEFILNASSSHKDIHWNGNVYIFTKFETLAAPKSTSSAYTGGNFIKTAFPFQCAIWLVYFQLEVFLGDNWPYTCTRCR